MMRALILVLLISLSSIRTGVANAREAAGRHEDGSRISRSILTLSPLDSWISQALRERIQAEVAEAEISLPLLVRARLAQELRETILVRFGAGVFSEGQRIQYGIEVPFPRAAPTEFARAVEENGRLEILVDSSLLSPEAQRGTYFRQVIQAQLLYFYDRVSGFSGDPRLRDLLGFGQFGVWFRSEKQFLRPSARSFYHSRLESAEEAAYAVGTLFLSDPEFRCRAPVLNRAFLKTLGSPEPAPGGGRSADPCQTERRIPLNDTLIAGSERIELDADRIYGIHFLFAGPGTVFFQRWGHAMIRFIVCAPGRALGPECLSDVSYHVTAGFETTLPVQKMRVLDGLLGRYEARVLMSSFEQAFRYYTEFDKRMLISVPLILSREETRDVVDLFLERFWTFRGGFEFFESNCATLLLDLLRTATGRSAAFEVNPTSPRALLQALAESGLIAPKAFRQIYPSELSRLTRLLEDVKAYSDRIQSGDFYDLVGTSTPESRLALYREVLADTRKESQKEVLDLLIGIELSMRELYRKGIRAHLEYVLAMRDGEKLSVKGREILTKISERALAYSRAFPPIHLSYGIPLRAQDSEVSSVSSQEHASLREMEVLIANLRTEMESSHPTVVALRKLEKESIRILFELKKLFPLRVDE